MTGTPVLAGAIKPAAQGTSHSIPILFQMIRRPTAARPQVQMAGPTMGETSMPIAARFLLNRLEERMDSTMRWLRHSTWLFWGGMLVTIFFTCCLALSLSGLAD